MSVGPAPRDAGRRRGRGLGALALAIGALLSCASRGGTGFEPRLFAIQNTLSAMGMAQVGPIQQGALGEGRDARLSVALPAGCSTIVVLGGGTIRALAASLVDGRGVPLAHSVVQGPDAALRPCVDAAETGSLVVKAVAGGGEWIAATWVGGPGVSSDSSSSAAVADATGTCESPIPLAPGVVTGSTSRGQDDNSGSCESSDSRELVYELDVPRRERVRIEVEARFDSVLYVRKDDCTDATAEIDCNDDAPDRTHSRIEKVLEPGKYFVFVDGYGRSAGTFKMTVEASDVVALADQCARAAALVDGVTLSGTTVGGADNAAALCAGGAEGADAVWSATLGARSRLRIVDHSDDVAPVLHVRRACNDPRSEVACAESGASAGDATVTGVFDPGTYAVFADAHERDAAGPYSLRLEVAPVAGTGVSGDACADAVALPAGASGTVAGDTFAARDDVAGSCGGTEAPDQVYRFDVARPSRWTAWLDGEEAAHVLVAWRRCGERGAELGCGRALDETLGPGTVYLGVDGLGPSALGRYTLHWAIRDLSGQREACARAPMLAAAQAVPGTTTTAGDAFVTSCAASDATGSAPDRVYKFVLPHAAKVHVALRAPSFHAVLALRAECADAVDHSLAEIACEAEGGGTRPTTIERRLEAGTYWVVVDGHAPADRGDYRLEYRVVPP